MSQRLNISKAASTVFYQLLISSISKRIHPVGCFYQMMTNKSVALTSYTKTIEHNAKTVRQFVHDYVSRRKSLQSKSEVKGNSDLLSLFLENGHIFTDEFIVDELLDFLLAGVITTRFASLTLLSHFAKSKESTTKVRDEMLKQTKKSDAFKEKLANLKEVTNITFIQDQEYLSWVLNETLRFQNSLRFNTDVCAEKELMIGKYKVRAGDRMVVNFQALHHNPEQWQRPSEFLPQRFDPEDPLYLTPSGAKRHSHSFRPFNGGKRICFGKTFAENTLKLVAIYMTHIFDMELLGEEYK